MISFNDILTIFWATLTFLVFLGFFLISVSRHREPVFSESEDLNVLVILPCKGVDLKLEDNIRRIRNQAYPNYSVIAVVDDEEDPAVEYLRNQNVDIQITSSECTGCSGKVRAIATVFEKHMDCDVYAVVDSDATVGKNWLRKLVAPLNEKETGVSTTFPVFVPDGGIWSVFKAVWGMVGSGMMESRLTRFVWGGSMAFRSDIIDDAALKEFKTMVSDDVAIMNIAKKKSGKIVYVKSAAPLVHSPDDFGTFFEWANRQTALSVSGSHRILLYGLIFYSLQIFLMVSTLLLAGFVYLPLAVFLVPFFITAFKNVRKGVKRRASIFAVSFVMPFFYFVNLIIAGRMSSINWRGNVYRLN